MAYIYFGVVHNIRPGKQAMKNINSLDIPYTYYLTLRS